MPDGGSFDRYICVSVYVCARCVVKVCMRGRDVCGQCLSAICEYV